MPLDGRRRKPQIPDAMQDILTAVPLVVILGLAAAFVFALVMQPIFIWIICARIKRTNQLLERLANKPQHTALVSANPMTKAHR